jgi:hypothetical protein
VKESVDEPHCGIQRSHAVQSNTCTSFERSRTSEAMQSWRCCFGAVGQTLPDVQRVYQHTKQNSASDQYHTRNDHLVSLPMFAECQGSVRLGRIRSAARQDASVSKLCQSIKARLLIIQNEFSILQVVAMSSTLHVHLLGWQLAQSEAAAAAPAHQAAW